MHFFILKGEYLVRVPIWLDNLLFRSVPKNGGFHLIFREILVDL